MRSALVVIDMLNDFLDGVLANPAAKGIVAPIGRLAEDVRGSDDWVVVYANDAHRPTDAELRVFPPHAMAGTHGAAVVEELAPRAGDVVVPKRFYSAFTETGLAATLRSQGVERLVLVGQHTDCCLRHTAYDAFRRDLELAVCADATMVYEPGSPEPVDERQARALGYLVTYYGAEVTDAASVS